MKLDIFTWIPASSAGMTMLLFAAQLNAAGVCIVCPPGHTCVAGSEPVLSGSAGQILQRTATGTHWVDTSAIQGSQGPTGPTGPQGPPGPNMSAAQLRATLCPTPDDVATEVATHGRCSGSNIDLSSADGFSHAPGIGVFGRYCWCQMESLTNPGCLSSWRYLTPKQDTQNCAVFCELTCANQIHWRTFATW